MTALEITVGVVDPIGKVIREKTLMVVPTQYVKMNPNEVPVTVPIDGFIQSRPRARSMESNGNKSAITDNFCKFPVIANTEQFGHNCRGNACEVK